MGERRGETDEPRLLVDRRRLNRRDLMAAEGLPHDVEAARERRIAKGLIMIPRVQRPNGCGERLLRIGELALSLRQGRGDRPDGFTGPLHGSAPRAKSELKALMPEDAKEASGHGVRAKRSKSGAVSFDLLANARAAKNALRHG